MNQSLPQTANFRQFAEIAGFKPGYVTQLRKAGRLVLTENRRKVRVSESLSRIEATRDPSKAGVAARHARNRTEKTGSQPNQESASDDDYGSGYGDYQHWRARNEKAKAIAAERENRVADGELLRADDVVAVVSHAFTGLRARLEGLSSVLSPRLAPIQNESELAAVMAEEIEHALAECSRSLAKASAPPQ